MLFKKKPGIFASVLIIATLYGFLFHMNSKEKISSLLSESIGSENIGKNEIVFGNRIMIIAPHPDDETIGCAGVIEKALKEDKQVEVVILTTGDGYKDAVEKNFVVKNPGPKDFQKLGYMRHDESINAMKVLGVPEQNVIFLGYPDGGTNGMWQKDWDYSDLHLGLNGNTNSQYPFSYEKHAPYCGANVVKNLSEILNAYNPTDIVYPDPNDEHHDHWAVNAFVKYVLTLQHRNVKEWTYLIHRSDFPWPWIYDPNLQMKPPKSLENIGTHWVYLPMDEKERALKYKAVMQYKSQITVAKGFLEAFIRRNELLGTYTDPNLPMTNMQPDFTKQKDFPFCVFLDASADTIKTKLEGSADIIAVGAVLSNDNLNIGFQTRKPINKNIEYNIRIRLFKPEGVKRFDFIIHGENVSQMLYAKNSIRIPQEPKLSINYNQLWLTIPRISDNSSAIFLSCDTVLNHMCIDKTAWRLVKIKKN